MISKTMAEAELAYREELVKLMEQTKATIKAALDAEHGDNYGGIGDTDVEKLAQSLDKFGNLHHELFTEEQYKVTI